MRLAVLVVITGCGFQGPFGVSPSRDGAVIDAVGVVGTVDAMVAPVDAMVAPVDATDPWPCGPEPAAPPATVTFGGSTTGMTISMIGVAGVQRYVASPGAMVAMTFRYSLHDTACANCIDQVEYGLVGGAVAKRIGCVFDQAVNSQVQTGNVSQGITLPTAPGRYDLRLAQAEDFSCNDTPSWYGGNPPAAGATIAIVCVH